MASTETLIRELADRAELADLVARHSLWIDEGRFDETDRLFTEDVVVRSPRGEAHDIAVFVIDDKTGAVAAGFHRYGARRTEDGWRFDRLEITPVALTEALGRAL